MVNFYLKYPEEYRRICREKPKSKIDTFEQMREKYEECDSRGNPVLGFDINKCDIFNCEKLN